MGLENLGKKIAQLGQDTRSSVQKMSGVISINSKIAEENDKLNELLAKIGSAAVEKFADNPPEGLEEVFGQVKAAKESIAALKEQRERMKGVVTCPECGKEYPVGEKFCSACGAKLPEIELAQKLTEDAKEAASEAGDAVNEVADKAKGFFNAFAGKADSFVKGFAAGMNKDSQEEPAKEAEEVPAEDAETEGEAPDVEEAFFEETQEEVDKAQEMGKKAARVAADMVSEAQKVAAIFAGKVTEAISAAKEKGEQEDIQEAAEDLAKAAGEACEEVCEDVKEACEEACEEVKETCEEACEEVTEEREETQEACEENTGTDEETSGEAPEKPDQNAWA